MDRRAGESCHLECSRLFLSTDQARYAPLHQAAITLVAAEDREEILAHIADVQQIEAVPA